MRALPTATGVLATAITLATTTSAYTQTLGTASIIVLEKGIYRSATTEGEVITGTAGAVTRIRGSTLITSTVNIPGRKGIRFGFKYVVVGEISGSADKIKMITTFPGQGMFNPVAGTRHFRNEYAVHVAPGRVSYREFHLDHDWEIVPGLWTFEFWSGDSKLGEQSFCVEPPVSEEGPLVFPDPAETCFLLLG